MDQGLQIELDPQTLERIKDLRKMIQMGAAAQEEMSGRLRCIAVQNGVDLDVKANLLIAGNQLLVVPVVEQSQPPPGA